MQNYTRRFSRKRCFDALTLLRFEKQEEKRLLRKHQRELLAFQKRQNKRLNQAIHEEIMAEIEQTMLEFKLDDLFPDPHIVLKVIFLMFCTLIMFIFLMFCTLIMFIL
jgi:hypothetical protein